MVSISNLYTTKPIIFGFHNCGKVFCVKKFLSNLCKNDLNTVLGRNLFSIANDCSVNPSDLSKMLVKKQMKYFYVPLDHAWKVPVLQELVNTRMNNFYVERFDDYVITEMTIMFCNE